MIGLFVLLAVGIAISFAFYILIISGKKDEERFYEQNY